MILDKKSRILYEQNVSINSAFIGHRYIEK